MVSEVGLDFKKTGYRADTTREIYRTVNHKIRRTKNAEITKLNLEIKEQLKRLNHRF